LLFLFVLGSEVDLTIRQFNHLTDSENPNRYLVTVQEIDEIDGEGGPAEISHCPARVSVKWVVVFAEPEF